MCAFHATNGPVWSFDIKAYLEGIYIGYHFSNPEPDENVFILETLSNTIGECQDHMFEYLPTSSVHGGYKVASNYMSSHLINPYLRHEERTQASKLM